jgi:hypothetical protein
LSQRILKTACLLWLGYLFWPGVASASDVGGGLILGVALMGVPVLALAMLLALVNDTLAMGSIVFVGLPATTFTAVAILGVSVEHAATVIAYLVLVFANLLYFAAVWWRLIARHRVPTSAPEAKSFVVYLAARIRALFGA